MHQKVNQYLLEKIKERKDKDAFRSFKINPGLIDFCSNDYLGFARDKELMQKTSQMLEGTLGNLNGSTGARTITGTSHFTIDLENYLAEFHQAEAALLYSSGYTANVGLFSSLPYRGDTVLYDELIHASIRDGMSLSKANSYAFKHNDVVALEKKLQLAKGKVYVVVESIYSMDGDAAPLKEISTMCEKYDAALIVDEAHSNGLFGTNGSGVVQALDLQDKVFARVMTFGKALGCHGAVVLGSTILKDFLVNYSRSFIYTTAPSPHQLFAIKNAYDKLSKSNHILFKISKLVNLFKLKVKDSFAQQIIESSSPIQCVIIPGNAKVKQLCSAIQQDGFDVRPIVAPTVPLGKERIRICFHTFNTEQEVEGLIASFLKNYKA